MNDKRSDDFDRQVQALHARALEQVAPRTLHALRVRRANAAAAAHGGAPGTHRRPWGWWLAAAAAAVFALAVGLRMPGTEPAADGGLPTLAAATDAVEAATYEDGLAALDEDPDLYLWLAAQDSQILAME